MRCFDELRNYQNSAELIVMFENTCVAEAFHTLWQITYPQINIIVISVSHCYKCKKII